MDSFLPETVLSGMARADRAVRRAQSRHLVVSGRRRHRVLELTRRGFVIETDGLPHLRGFVDILRGDERIARRLAQFAWARDGLAAYEFKQDAGARDAAADYVKPEAAALIGPPAGAEPEPDAR